MNDTPITPSFSNERIAKVIARSGVASRRDAEKMILAGRVAVNGQQVATPALDVSSSDKITIDGKPIDAPQETRLWLYYKPLGLVTTEKDEQGRRTIFDEMPEGMPRVLNVGRLDLNSEGLLLLTNDGGLKRRLELPETGWLRKYRVRVNGRPSNETFNPLRDGITIEGEEFLPMEVQLDRQQGANAWLTVGIREGRNREIRRAMTEIGLQVNRLIRISYGPFRLLDMKPGELSEVRRKMLRDQLGGLLTGEADATPERSSRDDRDGGDRRGGKPRFEGKPRGDRRDFKPRGDRPEGSRSYGDKPRYSKDRDGGDGDKRSYGKPRGDRPEGGRSYGDKPRYSKDRDGGDGDKRSYGKPRGDRPEGGRSYSDKPRYSKDRDGGDGDKRSYGKPRGDRPEGGRSYGDKPRYSKDRDGGDGDKRSYGKPRGDRPEGGRSYSDKPRYSKDRDGGDGDKRSYGKPRGDRPEGGRSYGDKPGFKGRSDGFKSHGGKPGGKPRSGGFKSHGDGARKPGGRPSGGAPRGKPRS